MSEPVFFKPVNEMTLGEIAGLTGAKLHDPASADRRVGGLTSLDQAGPHDLTFFENIKYVSDLRATLAGACLTSERHAASVPPGTATLITPAPYRAFVAVSRAMFPDALRPSSLFQAEGITPGAFVHASARLENGVTIDPGVVIGPQAEIGAGTVIAAGAAIGPNVKIGRDCAIGANASITHAIIGDRVIIHAGACIGQDGFGFSMGPRGHLKVPQIGRVIIQDDVEIGACTAVDRGAIRDTVIGEGTKIDNHVQIAHNVSIGRHCVIVAQSGIAGSTTLEDFVALGARAGANTHSHIGEGAQIAAASIAHGVVPPGARFGGVPARPAKQWFREMKAIQRLGRQSGSAAGDGDDETAGQ